MNYEQKYNEALERAKEFYNYKDNIRDANAEGMLEEIFPELKESEDEKIRKELITHCRNTRCVTEEGAERIAKWIAWLEKQGEQEPTIEMITPEESLGIDSETYNEIVNACIFGENKPKFKVGNWITDGQIICKILGITGKSYELHLCNDDYCHFETDVQSVDEHYHLWTIQDAKDGDVLATLDYILIFEKIFSKNYGVSHCHYGFGNTTPQFNFNKDDNWYFGKEANVYPATKEQRDLLFQKMHEEGYEWDAVKKELKKVEQKPAWSEEDEKEYKYVLRFVDNILNNCGNKKDYEHSKRCYDWLKSLKQRIKKEAV